jgi:hypothetical protein
MVGSRSRRSSGTHMTSLCALTGTTQSHTCRALRTQIAADLLRSAELKFDQLGGAVSLYSGEPRGSPHARAPGHADRHQATAADEWPPACKA